MRSTKSESLSSLRKPCSLTGSETIQYLHFSTLTTTLLIKKKYCFTHCMFHCTSIISLSSEKSEMQLKVTGKNITHSASSQEARCTVPKMSFFAVKFQELQGDSKVAPEHNKATLTAAVSTTITQGVTENRGSAFQAQFPNVLPRDTRYFYAKIS